MAGNTFGKLFTVTTFGESHGIAIGGIIDGCPPGLELCEEDLQGDLDRRKPGTSRYTTARREEDEVKINNNEYIETRIKGLSYWIISLGYINWFWQRICIRWFTVSDC